MNQIPSSCEHCGKPCEPSFEVCEECCEHEFDADEGFHCLSCGKNGYEEMMAMAYDRAKDARKYGDV